MLVLIDQMTGTVWPGIDSVPVTVPEILKVPMTAPGLVAEVGVTDQFTFPWRLYVTSSRGPVAVTLVGAVVAVEGVKV
jgi:hypothetical protein